MPNIYLSEFKKVAREAFARWNREPASPSCGSFDRAYWGWKYKDFSDATLQYAVILTVEYSIIAGLTSVIPSLLENYVHYCRKIQLKDGSFDQCYPNEKTPGVVYDILSALIYVRNSSYLASQQLQRELDGIIGRAVGFVLRTDEKHGAIANHIARYAYELFYYFEYSKDERARQKGEEYLERLISLFDEGEGWFQEYHGPDPGYQTFTMRYLAKCAVLLDRPELWTCLQKSAEFMEKVLMPDGSVHPLLGTRSTALLYPSSFEVLASREAKYHGLAARVRHAWELGLVPLPSWLDFDNAIRLADDAREAAEAYASCAGQPHNREGEGEEVISGHPPEVWETAPPFPDAQVRLHLPHAGILVIRRRHYLIYLGYSLGGVVVVYGRQGDAWRLLYEDSGYLLFLADASQAWISRLPQSGFLAEAASDRFVIRANFFQSRHEEVTPGRFLVLRLLNLTVLRSRWLGDWFRKLVVGRLVLARKSLPLSLRREIILREEEISVCDRIEDGRRNLSPGRRGRLFRGRRLTGLHMASSRYFQEQELAQLPLGWLEEVAWTETAAVSKEITIKVSPKEF